MKQLLLSVIAFLVFSGSAQADPEFDQWVKGLRTEAISRGISASLVDKAFRGVKPLPRVLELDRKQPEKTMTFVQYAKGVVSQSRIQQGRQMMIRYGDLLNKVGEQYGVQPRFIVALWGIETFYGRNTGGYNVVESLATLAYDGRRSRFFRKELLNALQILQEGHASLSNMKGSWAGAMGQCQFMPSSFLQFAVDFDGDGRKDIWSTPADVFASAANYLSQSGWQDKEIWGRRTRLPNDFDTTQATLHIEKSLQTWQKIGVRRSDGGNLPSGSMKGSIVLPDRMGGPAYLVYDNFRVLMKWNRSTYFATSVGLLADAIAQ